MSHVKISRRTFHRTSAVAAVGLTALQTTKVWGANDRIRLGFIGLANRGGQLITAFLPHPDMEIVALCDVAESTLAAAHQRLERKPDTYKDFRKILERKDIDAVVIATPDHWHALQTIHACEAEKDVYVEKPVSLTVFEGRKMVEAAPQETDCASRPASPLRPALCTSRANGPVRHDWEGDRFAQLPPQQYVSARDWQVPAWRTACGSRLGHVARAAAQSSVPGHDCAVQVPLVDRVLQPDLQQWRALAGHDALADERPGPHVDLLHGREVHRG